VGKKTQAVGDICHLQNQVPRANPSLARAKHGTLAQFHQLAEDSLMSALDEGLMATLTQEERAAMQATDDSAVALSDDKSGLADAPTKASEDLPTQSKSAAPAPEAPDAEAKSGDEAIVSKATEPKNDSASEPLDARPVQTHTTIDVRPQPVPRYEARLPDDFDAQVKALADKELNLKQQFKAGEIEFDEFEQARSELLVQREQLTIARTKAEISQEMNAQTAEQLWVHAVNEFMSDTAKLSGAAGGIDYRKDSEKASDLDGFVRSLAARSEHAHQSMAWFLTEAHKRVLALHGIATKTPADQTTDSDSAATPPVKSVERKPPDRKPPFDIAPKTLAMIPGGEGPGDVDGEFAEVLALDGFDYEHAIARMSAAQRERFLRAA
jgi:hypothetical protein